MKFKAWYNESAEPNLSYLLGAPGTLPSIGEETGEPVGHGIAKFVSPHGSFRYVCYVEGQAVSAIQVVVAKGKRSAHVANIFTHPNHRREGFATQILQQIKLDFNSIKYPPREERSDLANQWIDGMNTTQKAPPQGLEP